MRIIKYVLLLAAAASVAGCIRSDDIRFTGVDNIAVHGLSAAEVTVGVVNESGRNIKVREAGFELRRNGSRIGSVSLRGEVLLPRRWSGALTLPLSISLDNPLGALSMIRAVESGAPGFTVSGGATLKSGMLRLRYEFEDEPLRTFVSRFGGLSDKLGFEP